MSDVYILLAFACALALMVVAISKWRIHPAIVLLVVVIALGMAVGIGGTPTLNLVDQGFGETIGDVGLIIFLGCVLGKMLEGSGAAERITHAVLRVFGGKRIVWAIALASMILGIPIFSDAVVVILMPLISQVGALTGTSMAQLGTALYFGAYMTAGTIPPTPGPMAAATFLDVNIAKAISWGAVISLPGVLVGTLYIRSLKTQVAPKPEYLPNHTTEGSADEEGGEGGGTVTAALPEADTTVSRGRRAARILGALTPLLLPIAMIMVGSFAEMLLPEESRLLAVLATLGHPIIALLAGIVATLPLLGPKWKEKEVRNDWVESGLRMAAMPIVVTGIGGSLALIVEETGVAENLADSVSALGLQPILIPMIVAALINIITGSNTLGVLTAAAIMQPLLGDLDITPLATFLACASGAQIFKHPNSSGFWVTVSLSNMDVSQGIRAVGGATAIGGLTCCAVTYLLTMFSVV